MPFGRWDQFGSGPLNGGSACYPFATQPNLRVALNARKPHENGITSCFDMSAAFGLDPTKRGVFLERITARLGLGGSQLTDSDLDNAIQIALCKG